VTARHAGYWLCTTLVGFTFVSGGVGHLVPFPQVVQGITSLGFPAYVVTILGVWKLLGGIVILLPRLALVKEWAYAGMIFDLTGASASQWSAGSDMRHIVVPLVIALIVAGSWVLRPEGRRLVAR
jgi:uncharacterized membrane protein YphA (DoxX/SURF4 family)